MSTEIRGEKCGRKIGELTNGFAIMGTLLAACCGPGEIVFEAKCPRCGKTNTFKFRPNA